MIIRSQDKKKILNLEQIRKIDCETNSVMVDDVSVIGVYSTEEKAIKVLDMICEEYKKYTSAKSMSTYFAFIQPKVFQMPSDEEVEV